MDPNLFYVDMDRVGEVLVAIIVLALFVERTLAVVFETHWYLTNYRGKDYKALIAFAVSFLVCWIWDFDAVSAVVLAERTKFLGHLITAGVIAGGSKAAVKLLRDWLDIKSSELRRIENEERAAEGVAPPAIPQGRAAKPSA